MWTCANFFIAFMYLVCLCAMGPHVWKLEGNSWESFLSFHRVGPEDLCAPAISSVVCALAAEPSRTNTPFFFLNEKVRFLWEETKAFFA